MKTFCFLILLALLASCSSNSEDDVIEDSTTAFDVLEMKVTNLDNQPPAKGDKINVEITVKNTGSAAGKVVLTPKISSSRFADYKNVTLPNIEKTLDGGETATVSMEVGPFLEDVKTEKRYALGRGEYFFESVVINNDKIDTNYSGRIFNVKPSTALLVPVIYNAQYLHKLNSTSGINNYLTSAFTRKVELYDNGNYTSYPGGFDEMMNVKHIFYPIMTQNVSEYNLDDGLCEKATALAGDTLGLTGSWKGAEGTQTANHGFDYLMALTPDSFGGVACGWINVQISGLFDFDLSVNRAQIVMIHETSHLFGSPHCDPLQSYVMCAGEKHQKYIDQGIYVYHINSRNQMSNRWD